MSKPTNKSTITLREIIKDNLRDIFRLEVAESQQRFVAPNEMSIAQAYFQPDQAWFRAIYADETPVGFLMLYDDPYKPEYFLWRLMVGAEYQRLGFGKEAIKLLVAYVKTRPNALELLTSYVPAEGGPGPFYHKLGFEETGKVDEGERVLRLTLRYDEGEASAPAIANPVDEVRSLLQKFQDGYTQRDPANLDGFMKLFGPEEKLEVIGTNSLSPGDREWCRDLTAVRNLVEGDWEHWGDVVYDVAGAWIFINGNTAWLATTGTVTDVISADEKTNGFVDFAKSILEDEEAGAKSKLLAITRLGNELIPSLLLPEKQVWPLRFTAVAVKTNGQWRFHQMQFSFATTGVPDERSLSS